MLRCYFLALSMGSSLDRDTNNCSIFNLVEQLTIPAALLGTVAPIEVQAYFGVSDDARHASFDMRLIRVAPDGSEDAGEAIPIECKEGPRLRVRIFALRLPRAFGSHELRVEWAPRGTTEWHAEDARWPLHVVDADLAASSRTPSTPAVSSPV